MYIRSVSQKNLKTGQVYTTYRLVEAYRNQEGKVRQQVLLNLGCNFNFPTTQWKQLADRIEEIRRGQQNLFEIDGVIEKEAHRISKLIIQRFSESQSKRINIASLKRGTDYQQVDIDSLEHQHLRKIGAEHVGLEAAKQLGLKEILLSAGLNKKQTDIALGTIIGRLVHPGSELGTHRYLTEQSGLDELLETDFSKLLLKDFYQISDRLLKHKSEIEEGLYRREKDLFHLEETITLFDLTNTYFEGRCLENPKARHGRSKEKRNDCPLVTLGLVLDASGFPKRSEIFAGNIGESKTLKTMLEKLKSKIKPTIVMDAGIATEENLTWLNASGYTYVVVSRKRNLEMPAGAEKILVKETLHNKVNVALVENELTDELELYCHSTAKENKTREMLDQPAKRYEIELQKIQMGLGKKNGTKKYEKILERLGRLKEKYKFASQFYEVSVTANAQKIVTSITWEKHEERMSHKQKGIYCLRTNRKDLRAKQFWEIYIMLTDLEAAFRNLKSELGLRPVYHQKEHRVDGHIFITILAYHLLHAVRYQLKMEGTNESWGTLRQLLSTQSRITSTMKLRNGKTLQIRKTSSPDTNQSLIYKALKIETHPGKTEKTYF